MFAGEPEGSQRERTAAELDLQMTPYTTADRETQNQKFSNLTTGNFSREYLVCWLVVKRSADLSGELSSHRGKLRGELFAVAAWEIRVTRENLFLQLIPQHLRLYTVGKIGKIPV